MSKTRSRPADIRWISRARSPNSTTGIFPIRRTPVISRPASASSGGSNVFITFIPGARADSTPARAAAFEPPGDDLDLGQLGHYSHKNDAEAALRRRGALRIDVDHLRQSWPRPSAPRPIVIIGAGGIVNDAHLPAYRLAGFPVAGVFDLDEDRARHVGGQMGHAAPSRRSRKRSRRPTPSTTSPCRRAPISSVLPKLPDGAAVLLQKPMGRDLAEATAILEALPRASSSTPRSISSSASRR